MGGGKKAARIGGYDSQNFLPRGISSTVAIKAAAQNISMDVKSGDANQAAYSMCGSELLSAFITAWIM